MVGPIAIALALIGAGILLGSNASGASGGGSRIQARRASVEGRDYVIIKRGPTEYEVFSPDDPEAWLVFDANLGVLRQGSKGADVDRDMRLFPKNLFAS